MPPQIITSGVIHSSGFSPLMFLLYLNDIFRAICRGIPYVFPGDIEIIFSFGLSSLPKTMAGSMGELNSLDDWYEQWAMLLSTTKCAAFAFKCHVPSPQKWSHNTNHSVCKLSRLIIILLIQLPRADG